MIATFQFDLNLQRERREWEVVKQATPIHNACLLFDNALRAEIAHGNAQTVARAKWARKLLKDFLEQEGADLWP